MSRKTSEFLIFTMKKCGVLLRQVHFHKTKNNYDRGSTFLDTLNLLLKKSSTYIQKGRALLVIKNEYIKFWINSSLFMIKKNPNSRPSQKFQTLETSSIPPFALNSRISIQAYVGI